MAANASGQLYWTQNFGNDVSGGTTTPPPPATSDTQRPSQPTGLTTGTVGQTSAQLRWTASTDNVGVTGYGIYVGGTLAGTVTGTSVTVSGLQCGKSYPMGVDAVDAAGNRSAITTITVSTAACSSGGTDTAAPTAPTGITVTSTSRTSVGLRWNASTDNVGVTGYRIWRGSTLLGTITSTSVTITGLACGTTYQFGIEARDAAGNVSGRTVVTVATQTLLVEPPGRAAARPSGQAAWKSPTLRHFRLHRDRAGAESGLPWPGLKRGYFSCMKLEPTPAVSAFRRSVSRVPRPRRPKDVGFVTYVALALVAGVLAAGIAAVVPSANAVTNCTPTSSWGTNRTDLASQVVSLINQYRASKGLSQLAVSSTLTASSAWKSLHMAAYGYFAHDDPAPPVARSAYQRAKDCGFTGTYWGENIAWGYTTAQSVVNGWLGSSGHKANIENPSFKTTGVGVASDASGSLIWTQSFGNDSSTSTPPPSTPRCAGRRPTRRSRASRPGCRSSRRLRRRCSTAGTRRPTTSASPATASTSAARGSGRRRARP